MARSRSRRWFLTCLILIFAAVFLWWDRRETSRDLVQVQQFATTLCDRSVLQAIDPGVPEALVASALSAACTEGAGRPGTEVRRGAGPGGDARVERMYNIIIRADVRERLGLRVSMASGTPIIVGYWLPSASEGEGSP